jgi:membrane protein
MARLGDVPKLLKSVGVLEFVRRVWRQVNDDNLFTWAAALAYSWLFALFPFMLFLLSLVPYLPFSLRKDAEKNVNGFLLKWLPKEAEETLRNNIEGNVSNLLHQPKSFLLYAGLLVALWAASSGMASTMSALDKCYELDRGRPFYRHRAVAIAMTIVVMLLMLLVACLLPVGSSVRAWVMARGIMKAHQEIFVIFDVVRWSLALVFMFSVVAIVYYMGPNIRHRFNWITPGSVFSVLVWVLLGIGFRVYVDRVAQQSYARTYGTLGGVAILLLLFYIDALVLLIGAEINSEIDFEVLKVRRGTRDLRKAESNDAPAPTGI